jgi:hypothetical protein
MAVVKFFATWQPLHNEDAHTALAFGFMRHAPTEEALAPWLAEVLGREVTPEPLEHENFWPTYGSVVESSQWTEPEIGRARLVVRLCGRRGHRLKSRAGQHRQDGAPYATADRQSEWVYDRRLWRPGNPDEDVAWALETLAASSTAWDGTGAPATIASGTP